MELRQASIDPASLRKGDRIEADLAWDQYAKLRPDRVDSYLAEFGSESNAKLARMGYVLMQIVDWIDKERSAMDLPMLVMTTKGNGINVLNDEEASRYLSDRAFAGLRQHARHTGRLLAAVDENNLSSAARREHEGRIRTHSFVLASTQGAQAQLRKLRKMGKDAPRLG